MGNVTTTCENGNGDAPRRQLFDGIPIHEPLPVCEPVSVMPQSPQQSLVQRIEQVEEFNAQRCYFPPDNRHIDSQEVQTSLMPSIEEHGQLQPGLVVKHPEIPDAWLVLDGARRCLACRILGIPFKSVLLEKMPTKAELILLRHHLNNNRKGMDKAENGGAMMAYQKEAICTEGEVAEAFGVSQSYANRLMAPFKKGIEELLEALRNGEVTPAVACKIASLTQDMQAKALAMVKGKKRDAGLRIVDGFAGKKEKSQKALKLKIGKTAELILREQSQEAVQAVIDALVNALKTLTKNPNLTVAMLPSLVQ